MFVALNTMLRRQRRRLLTLAVVLGLVGAVVSAHSVLPSGHMGDGVAMCLAVAESAVITIGAAVVAAVGMAQRPRWLVSAPPLRAFAHVPAPRSVPARAGPPLLQVFRL